MIDFALTSFGIFIIFGLFVLFGLLGGSMAKNDGKSYWLGFAIGIFGNISGLLILAYIGDASKKRTFQPNFKDRSNEKTSAIHILSTLNDQGKLNDQEFERLKQEIINTWSPFTTTILSI